MAPTALAAERGRIPSVFKPIHAAAYSIHSRIASIMRDAFVARQSEKVAIPKPVCATARVVKRDPKFNFDSPMVDSTALWPKSNKQKTAAILLYG